MNLDAIIHRGRKALIPRALAELVAQRYGTEAEFLFSAIHSTGHWSMYLKLLNGYIQHVSGTFDNNNFYLSPVYLSPSK